jgi:large subunit ribosomal protein L31
MKSAIHPTYFAEATVTCACGNVFKTGSTMENVHTELCSACHPFFTGTQKIIDTARRVEKFQTRQGKKAAAPVKAHHTKEAARKAKRAEKAVKVEA